MNNEVLKAIRERRSIRCFKPLQIKDEELNAILDAGTWAPTAKGMQNPLIVAVQNEQLMQEIVSLNAQVLGTSGNPFFNAPTIILVFGTPEWKNYIQDGSLVLGTMMLAAHSIGVGTCWINREIEMFRLPEGKVLMKKLHVPEAYGGIGALAVGYPDGPAKMPKPRKENYYNIIK